MPVPMNRAAVVVAAALLSAPAAAHADPVVLTSVAKPTAVGAVAGWTAWSRFTDGRYVLETRSPAGVVTRPAIASRRVPFDLDLGLGAGGAPVAAYSRCSAEPHGTPGERLPVWTTGRGCRIVLLDLARGTERRLSLSRGSASDVLPSVAGGAVAFIRVPKARADRRRAVLAVRDLAGRHARGLLRGPRRDTGASTRFGPVSVDTDGRLAAVVFANLDTSFNSYDHELRVVPLGGGRAHTVDAGSQTEDCQSRVLAPTLTGGGAVTWIRQGSGGWAFAAGHAGGTPKPAYASAVQAESSIVSAAVDGTRLVLAGEDGAITEQALPATAAARPDDAAVC